jgi:hypothetical protein
MTVTTRVFGMAGPRCFDHNRSTVRFMMVVRMMRAMLIHPVIPFPSVGRSAGRKISISQCYARACPAPEANRLPISYRKGDRREYRIETVT